MSSSSLKWGIALTCAFAILISLSGIASGQATDGNLTGTVLDSTGAAVPNAAVEAENVATGIKTRTTSGADGTYRLNNLPVGTYKVTASATGLAAPALQV